MIRVLVQSSAIEVAAEFDLHDAGGHGASASFIGRVRGDIVGGLTHGQELGRLVVGDPHAVVVLELDRELDEVQRVRTQVLLEAGVVPDHVRIDLQLVGEMRAYGLEDLVPSHPRTRR